MICETCSGKGGSCEIQFFNPGGGLQKTMFLSVTGLQKTMFLSVRLQKTMFLSVNDVSFSHPPGLKNWISQHPLGQVVSAVVPSSSALIGVCIRLSLTIPVLRHKMTGTSRGLRQLAVQDYDRGNGSIMIES